MSTKLNLHGTEFLKVQMSSVIIHTIGHRKLFFCEYLKTIDGVNWVKVQTSDGFSAMSLQDVVFPITTLVSVSKKGTPQFIKGYEELEQLSHGLPSLCIIS